MNIVMPDCQNTGSSSATVATGPPGIGVANESTAQ